MRTLLGGAAAALILAACGGPDTPEPAEPLADAPVEIPPAPPAGEATDATRAANRAVAERLPLDERSDFDDAARGRIAQIEAEAILDADGRTVWPIAQYAGVADGAAPDTVNPSLWRQAKLTNMHGLFEVTDGIWQVRGYDLSVMTVIRGETGWILIDPLLTEETAAASLQLVNDTLGERSVTGILYTHSHADHFGGVRGVIDEADAREREVPILAPIGFSDSAVAENLLAGNHMSRRAALMFGNALPIGPAAKVSIGLGPGLGAGTIGLIAPTEEIEGRGTQRTVDGIIFEFVDAAGTEAPAEFMFYLPQFDALCTAEVATATFHNALTPRGAKIRDLKTWSEAIDHVLVEYGDADLVFASHHWPTWGEANVRAFLRGQRDIYRYTHDQALRRANRGETMVEIAEALDEPPVQASAFDTRGYYGTLNHNAKAAYQFYFGWWDGVPANYHAHPPEARAVRLVAAMGGIDAAIAEGRRAFEAGDYRWAADVLNHAVFAEPGSEAAKDWLAAAYEQLGFQAESGAWRAYYLTAAQELREGLPDVREVSSANAEFLAAVPTRDLFDAMAARYAPETLERAAFLLHFRFTDTGEDITVDVGTATAFPRAGPPDSEPAATLTLTRTALDSLILRERGLPALMASGEAAIDGDPSALAAYFAALETPPFWFNVVEP